LFPYIVIVSKKVMSRDGLELPEVLHV